MRTLAIVVTCLCLSASAWAEEPEPQAAPAAAEESAAPAAAPGEANLIQQLAASVRGKVMDKLEEKITQKQEATMDRLSSAFGLFGLLGFLLIFTPLFLMRRYPGKLWVLVRYSALSAVLFVVAVNLFASVLMLLRGAQAELGRFTNPQMAVVEAAFNTLENKGAEYAAMGPSLVEPTLRQLTDDSDEPLPILLLQNAASLKKDAEVFFSIASFFKSINWLFGYLPILMTLIAVALFALATRPTLMEIIRLPQRAAEGREGAVKAILKATFGRIGRELLATLGTIGVLMGVSVLGGAFLTRALEPAIEGFMDELALSLLYLQSAEASSGLILLALGGTLVFLALNLAAIVVPSGMYLGKAQKIFQRRLHDKVPLKSHGTFWLWGTIALVGSMGFPLAFILLAEPLATSIVEKSFDPQAPSWGVAMALPPLLLTGLFLAAFWAVRGVKGILFLARYKVAPPPAARTSQPSPRSLAAAA